MKSLIFSLIAIILISATVNANPSKRQGTKVYCTPSQSCWPTQSDWASFNSSINGNLIKVTPWQSPCYVEPNGYQQPACQSVRLNYFNGEIRSDQIGATQLDNWSRCVTNAGLVGQCELTASTTGQINPLPVTGQTCQLGRLSPYGVNVQTNQDAVQALQFAQKFNIKVVIKNTGHEYLGRSTALDSLMIWTHNLQSTSFQPNWQGSGKDALALGAGVSADQAYTAAGNAGRSITLGAYSSVGVAGGYAMGGGHGPLGPKYGLAVDNILQYTIVTADGQIRNANANSNQDLYYALRGGGGGTWGVVTEVIYQVHPSTPMISVVYNVTLSPLLLAAPEAQQQAAYAELVSKMAEYQLNWTLTGWSGYTFLSTPGSTFAQFLPSDDLVAAKNSMAGMVEYFATSKNFVSVPVVPFVLLPNFETWRATILNTGAGNTPVAYSERLASRLIPYTAMNTTSEQQELGNVVAQAMFSNKAGNLGSQNSARVQSPLQIYSTSGPPAAFGGPSGNSTGVNTAWRSSLWEVVIASAWTNELSQSNRNLLAQQTSQAANGLRKYGTGTYFSESDVLEPNWQEAFFGGNYEKLVQIKQKYDPNNVFVVWKGIGYQGQESQAAFACYQQA
ncbi:FAD-binding domain-containing protein [Meira miltonrushii]|uniref:FAD-binding domain-containing protein n=1 Tax=Meira miltonrushii TaxID=1280837 RepID=A0A316VBV2_9BASI|nr:FAD-binding domain-containing protein [Meira miltonrushii]PWN34598.1 FAD-binding domain-containing protein [Meira miltonrushii]